MPLEPVKTVFVVEDDGTIALKRGLFERWYNGEQQELPINLCKDE